MKKVQRSFKWIALLSSLLFVFVWALPAAAATPRIFQMKGKITAVDTKAQTVVINVPLGKKGIFTVAGPLAADAVLKKDGKKAALKDFHKGEEVVVRWQYTKSGHLIKGLRGE